MEEAAPRIRLDGSTVTIDHLACADQVLVALVERTAPEGRAELVEKILGVGARGIVTMGVGLDLSELDHRVRQSVELATDKARREIDQVLDVTRKAVESTLDPDQRTSLVGKALDDLQTWRDEFLGGVDPDRPGSHTERLLGAMRSLLGPGGELEERLAAALDLDASDSAFSRFTSSVDTRLTEIRDMVAEQRGRQAEALRGTAKGIDFEDDLEIHLRNAVAGLSGAVVERTSSSAGSISADSIVGDFVVGLPDGARVVVEAKNTRTLSLTGRQSILEELDRAMANRMADVAVCVSAQEAFPREVGPFGVYGRRLLVVEDGDGTMTWVAMRWAAAMAQAMRGGNRSEELDVVAVDDIVQRIRQLGQVFSTNRRTLTDVTESVDRVRSSLDGLRRELLTLVDDLSHEMARGRRPEAEVLDIRREAG